MYITEIDGRPVKHLGTIIEKRTDSIDCPIYDEGKRIAVINDYQFFNVAKRQQLHHLGAGKLKQEHLFIPII